MTNTTKINNGDYKRQSTHELIQKSTLQKKLSKQLLMDFEVQKKEAEIDIRDQKYLGET